MVFVITLSGKLVASACAAFRSKVVTKAIRAAQMRIEGQVQGVTALQIQLLTTKKQEVTTFLSREPLLTMVPEHLWEWVRYLSPPKICIEPALVKIWQ